MLNEEQVNGIRQLRNDALFSKVFKVMNEKYRKTGRYGGKIKFDNLSESEKLFFSTIDINIMEQSYAEFTVQNFFKKKVLTGILCDVTISEFWGIYNEKRIITNNELKKKLEAEKFACFKQLLDEYKATEAGRWLMHCLETKKNGYVQMMKAYSRAGSAFINIMRNVMNAVNNYPRDGLLAMPIFATRLTRNPHYFDYGSEAFNLLMHGFCFISGDDYPDDMESFQTLMVKFGLVKDLVSNQILTFNISAEKDGKIHEGIQKFNSMNEILALTLKSINSYDSITVKNNILYVFENPSIFSTLSEEFQNISMICTSGNLKLSAISLLDKSAKNCDKIYYSGDLDPEGLKIADYLKKRYGEQISLWRMSPKDYNFCMSQVTLTDKRLNKLKSIQDKQLKETAAVMSIKKRAGYQEYLLECYMEDIANKTT